MYLLVIKMPQKTRNRTQSISPEEVHLSTQANTFPVKLKSSLWDGVSQRDTCHHRYTQTAAMQSGKAGGKV